MRAGQVAVIALVAAALGGLVVLGGVAVLGVGDEGDTVMLSTVEEEGAQAAPAAKPQLGNEFDPAEIYRRRSPGVVTIYSIFDEQPASADDQHAAQGSGFVVSPEGYLLTSSHVISTAGENQPTRIARRVYVAFRDNDRVDAEVVGVDLNDAVGVVSSNSRSIPSLTSSFNVVDAIQTDAPITHGNSGGPLLDSQGRVIGINAQIRSESGDSEGVGFAIPINAAKRSMKQLIEKGRVAYAYVGVTAGTLTPTLAERFDYRVDRGAVVERIALGSPGLRAGLRCGRDPEFFRGVQFKKGADVIVAIDGRPVRSADDLVRIVSERLEPGQQSDFEIVRGGERKTVAVRLAERPRGAAAYACS